MDAQSLTTLFIGITAFSFLLQSLAIFGIYSRLKQVSARVDDLSTDVKKKLAAVSESVQQSVEAIKPILEGFQKVNENLLAVSVLVRDRAVDLDRFVEETTNTLRAQLVRVDDVVDNTTARIEKVVDTWHRGVIAPAYELAALIKAFKTGFNFFFSRKEGRTPSRNQPDDELFI